MAMTNQDEATRVRIAEIMGYRMVEGLYAFPSIEMVKARVSPEIFEQICAVDYEVIPDYLNDLNAAFQAVEWLRKEKGMSTTADNRNGMWDVYISEKGKPETSNVYITSTTNESLPRAICSAFLACFPEEEGK
jgi:hypothetical protein